VARVFFIPTTQEQNVIFTAPLDITVVNLGAGINAVVDPEEQIGVSINISGIGFVAELDQPQLNLNVETHEIDIVLETGISVNLSKC